MSSIAISLDSSRTAPELPRYTGPDYRAALAGELGLPDPLLHPDPYRPPALYRVALARIHWLLPLRKGVAHFALQAGVPIVPVALEGVDRLRPFTRVVVSVGKPIWPDPPAWWIPSRRVLEIVDRVRRGILRAFDRPPRQRRRLLARLGAGVRDRLGRLTSWRGRSPS